MSMNFYIYHLLLLWWMSMSITIAIYVHKCMCFYVFFIKFQLSLTWSLLPITSCLCLRMSIVCLAMCMFLWSVSSFGFHWQDLSFLLLTDYVYEWLWCAWLCLCFYALYLVSVIRDRISPSYYWTVHFYIYGWK